ncbi:MAG TPA: hypothetical protein PK360_09615 [bacterium]|nr:hypothetical protein [bacterium]
MKRNGSWIMVGLVVGGLVFSGSARADLIGFWKFDEGSGEKAADSSGQGKDGTIVNPTKGLGEGGSVWVKDPVRGSVISFGGTAAGAYVQVGKDIVPAMKFDTNFTWAIWIKVEAGNAGNNVIFGNRKDINAAEFSPREFIKFTPTKFEFHANALGTDNLDYADPPIGVWVHHVIVKNGPLLIYYRNGVVVRTQPQTLELNNPQPLFMGGDNEKAEGEMFKGYLDNARIYNEALSGRAVLDLYLSEGPANVTPAEWESQP